MKKVILIALPFVLAACTGTPRTPHWNPNATPRDENWHSPAAALLRYDTNHDGILTRAEVQAGLKAEFDTYDVGRKNCLGPDQVRAINQMRVQQDASQATPLVDWNQDNCIDLNEYSGAALSLFDTLDKNSDGQLTADELKPKAAHPQGGQGGGHRGGRGPGRGRGGGDPDGR